MTRGPGIPDLLWSALTVGHRPPLTLLDRLGREVAPVLGARVVGDGVEVTTTRGVVVVRHHDRERGLAVLR